MTRIRWEDPPQKKNMGGAPRVWAPLLAPLKERPLQWARLKDYPTKTGATNARSSLTGNSPTARYLPPGPWEFVTRSFEDGTSALYGRYMGNGER